MLVKSAASIAKKWARVTPERSIDYEEGVKNPLRDWATETLAAESRYEEGVKAGISRKAFGKGVSKVGTAKQKAKTILKGIPRWPEGVRVAQSDMEAGMKQVVEVLKNLTLPPRYAKGDPRNIERVRVIQQALHKMKTG